MWRTAELDVSAGCVAEGVFTLCLFPVTVAVVRRRVREVGGCSLDVRVRSCRMQGRRRRRRVRLEVVRGRRQASRGKTTRRGRGAGRRRADRGGGGVRSGGGADAADAANPLLEAVR